MQIRRMTPDDLEFAAKSTAREGWLSESKQVFEGFLANDPEGCLVGEIDGRPAGLLVATPYQQAGFLGELIVNPELRNQGLGQQLMEAGIAYLQQRGCGSIYLDGDLPAIGLYERLGFHKVCQSLRFIGHVRPEAVEEVRCCEDGDIELIIHLDRVAFGQDRSYLLRLQIEENPTHSLVKIESGRVIGYIMARPAGDIFAVGPWLMMPSRHHPLVLLPALAATTGDHKLRLGVLETNERAVVPLREMPGLEETTPCWRMVLGEDIGLGDSERLLAVGAPSKG